MGKSLVIVESPAKAKTINKYLGKGFIVKSSIGHIRDLPKTATVKKEPKKVDTKSMSKAQKEAHKAKQSYLNLVSRMGVDPDHKWKANYEILPGKEKVVEELKKLAENSDCIYLATDLDREGEAIAWHLQEVLGYQGKTYQRVVFNEITQSAIQDAFKTPSEVDLNKVEAQQARRFLDRVVGFMVSPLLWKKVARGLSAGRVQSVAVRLIVEREKEIKSFIPEEFWDIHVALKSQESTLRMQVIKHLDQNFRPQNQSQADAAVNVLEQATYEVMSLEQKPSQSKPSAPFITSTLQQAASSRLGFGVKKTMMLAQRLYEAGYITYMRTDSTNLSQEAVANARELIQKQFGADYLPEHPINYSSKKGAQEAHEAIRPSDVHIEGAFLKDMESDARRLYELIWKQFVACQMTHAKFHNTTLMVEASGYHMKAKGRTVLFDGWTKVQPQQKKSEDDLVFPVLKPGDRLVLNTVETKQNFTKPVARFNEASLVRELEKRGIGRPSTYASIISTIQERGYVKTENKRFFAEKMGEIVNERLTENFSDLMNYDFTAAMEKNLDDIGEGNKNWRAVLDDFYTDFQKTLEQANQDETEGGMRSNQMVLTDIQCPDCSREMGIRTATTGVFLGCSGYQLSPKERCKKTLNLISGDEAIDLFSEDAENALLRSKRRCQVCDTSMDSYLIDEHRKLHVCGDNPRCYGYEVESGQFKIKGYDGPTLVCDKCESEMQLKTGRFGKYFACMSESCTNTRKLLRNGEAAPPKEDPIHLPDLVCSQSEAYFVLRDGASGIFLAAHTFPKSRETRAPLVEELVRFKSKIWPKYQFLTEAPLVDDEGNKTVVKFSRKTKQQYVASEIDRKATGWQAMFIDGKWRVTSRIKKAMSQLKEN